MPLAVPILKPQKCHLFTLSQWKSGLERWTGDRLVLSSNLPAANSLRNFGNSVYQCLSEETLKVPSIFTLTFIGYGPV